MTPDRLYTVVFDDEDEYVRFTDYVWDHVDPHGIELSDAPIHLSIRVPRWILEEIGGDFALRLVTREDVQQAVEGLLEEKRRGRKPFDPASLTGFQVPGVPGASE